MAKRRKKRKNPRLSIRQMQVTSRKGRAFVPTRRKNGTQIAHMKNPKQPEGMPQPGRMDDIELILRSWQTFVNHHYGGRRLLKVELRLDNGQVIRLPVPGCPSSGPAQSAGRAES